MSGRPPNARGWKLNIQSDPNALNDTYAVYLFLGDVQPSLRASSLDWLRADTWIGRHVALSGCTPNGPDITIQSLITLDGPLQHFNVRLSQPDQVVKFVQENLRWRIGKASAQDSAHYTNYTRRLIMLYLQLNGEVIPNSELPSLKIVLLSMEKTYNAEFQVYLMGGHAIEHLDCTACSSGY